MPWRVQALELKNVFNTKIVIRADASISIGSGHVMRCLTLADALRESGAEIAFISRSHPGNLFGLIRDRGFRIHELRAPEVLSDNNEPDISGSRYEYRKLLGVNQEEDALSTIAALQAENPEWLIVDHYSLDSIWELMTRPFVRKMMVIDDLADRNHECDLLLDQNYMTTLQSRYTDLTLPSCTRLLGPEYALLRPEFVEARSKLKTRDGIVNRLFLFFGGSDPDNVTAKALSALNKSSFKHLDVDVVVGSSNPHRLMIRQLVEERPRTTLHIQVDNMAELMAQADLAICAGGSSTWERLSLGLPSLVVNIADNQLPMTRDLNNDGFVRWLGSSAEVNAVGIEAVLQAALINPERNRQESDKGLVAVDGKGVDRIVSLMTQGTESRELVVRKALDRDCELFWCWANDPEVRTNAFSSDKIPWEHHKKWFIERISDEKTTIYVIENGVGPVGQVRLEKKDGYYFIDYSVARQYRGLGLGKKIISAAITEFTLQEQVCSFVAEVKLDNTRSNKVFERLGFKEITDGESSGIRRFLLDYAPAESRNE